MRYVAAVAALGLVALATPAGAQEVIYEGPAVTYYAPSVPVTSYYYPTYTSYYAPSVAYYPSTYYYVPPRVARRWYRAGYWGW